MASRDISSMVLPFERQDIRSLIDAQVSRRGDHPFLVWEPFTGEARSWTYREFANRLYRFAAGLHARGVKSGDFVLVHLDNCPESIIAWIGCAVAGAIAVTTNAKSSADELSYFASHSGAVAGITQPKFAELVAGACKDLKWIAVTETDNGDDAGANRPSREQSFERIDADASSLPKRAYDPRAPFSVQYTSGTTSRPKGVLWTHANALWGARVNAVHEDLQPSDTHLVILPLFHTNAQAYSILSTLWAGATAVVQPRFSASRFWPVSLKHGCTWASIVPFCLRALMEHEVPKHSYRLWGNGICEPPTDAHFKVKTLGWWGMTETITQGTLGNIHLPNLPMSMGRPVPEYDIRVVRDDGRPVEVGETGDLLIGGVRGLSLFSEYLKNPKATADSFNDDGFFLTGDRVTLAPDGFLVFADRSKDMLKVGGENVAASEIERVIMLVSGVREVACVGKRDKMYDEVPVVFVIPEAGVVARQPDFAEKIIAECRQKLATFKVPREVRLVESLPRSTLEKVAKAELRKLL
jgi:crotonobetaine/carnitine-CoA ligase